MRPRIVKDFNIFSSFSPYLLSFEFAIEIWNLYNRIKENGCIMFEVGYDEGDSVSDILNECGYVNVEIIKDLAGMDRVVKAYKSSRHIEGE